MTGLAQFNGVIMRHRLFLVGIVLMLLVSSVRFAQAASESEVIADYSRVMRLYDQTKYQEALTLAESLTGDAERIWGSDDPNMVKLFNMIGLLHYELGHYNDADQWYQRGLALAERLGAPAREDLRNVLTNLGSLRDTQRRDGEAVEFHKRSMAISEQLKGPDDLHVGWSLNNIGGTYGNLKRWKEAEEAYLRALRIKEKALGPNDPDVGLTVSNLGTLYTDLKRWDEAERYLVRAIDILERAYGNHHPRVATANLRLGNLRHERGNLAEAERYFKKAIAAWKASLGAAHPDVALGLGNLARLYKDQARYGESITLLREVIAARERALGAEHPDVANEINSLGNVLSDTGRHAEAEKTYLRALAIINKTEGRESGTAAMILDNIGLVVGDQGRYGEAETFLRKALAIKEKVHGADSLDVAHTLNNIASLFNREGRYDEGEKLIRRALAVREKAAGKESLEVATSLFGLGNILGSEGRYDAAEVAWKKGVAIRERLLGPDHPDTISILNSLANQYQERGKPAEAVTLHQRILAERTQRFGADSEEVATSLNNLANAERDLGQLKEAEGHARAAVIAIQKKLGREHPTLAIGYRTLAQVLLADGRPEEARSEIRAATDIARHRWERASTTPTPAGLAEQREHRGTFAAHLEIIAAQPKQTSELADEAFLVGELARTSGTALSINRMSVRLAAGEGTLAKLIRQHQEATSRWRQSETTLLAMMAKPPSIRSTAAASQEQKSLEEAEKEIVRLGDVLRRDFPAYDALAGGRPASAKDLQPLLAENEAFLSFLVTEKESFLSVVRHDGTSFHRLEAPWADLFKTVNELRRQLDLSRMADPEKLDPFDTAAAHRLYQLLISPVRPRLDGVQHLILATDGPLESLPFSLLVTAPPEAGNDPAAYRKTAWLMQTHAVSVVPAASSLVALRRMSRTSTGARAFIGFGDPVLGGAGGTTRNPRMADLFARGGTVRIQDLRRLAPLPETADELRRIAASLKAGPESLFLGKKASEPEVRKASLKEARIIAFATHAVVAGELGGLAEPALVLTPPEKPAPNDDGVLVAGEIAALTLDADMVVLSACNTAASDGSPRAEGLSGLAKAFFHAGARSVLVSHWPVESESAAELTTRMLEFMVADPPIGRAEALRRSMLALAMNSPDAWRAHPVFWAPFIIAGEGGRR